MPGHDALGQWENFDLNAVNPAWAPYPGAWEFSKNSGTTFQTNNDLHQFGPHIGGAYQLSNKLVVRASYGIFYVPLGSFRPEPGIIIQPARILLPMEPMPCSTTMRAPLPSTGMADTRGRPSTPRKTVARRFLGEIQIPTTFTRRCYIWATRKTFMPEWSTS